MVVVVAVVEVGFDRRLRGLGSFWADFRLSHDSRADTRCMVCVVCRHLDGGVHEERSQGPSSEGAVPVDVPDAKVSRRGAA